MTDHFGPALLELRNKGLWREIKYMEAPQTAWTVTGGRPMMLLSSNSYLGLSGDPRLIRAAVSAVETYGAGSGGSRLTSGSFTLHRELEKAIALFKKTDASILFNTGYMANTGTIAAIADAGWSVYCDKLNHASIIDGIRLSRAEMVVYRHNDMKDLREKAGKRSARKSLIVTDGVFSMDGDIARIPDIIDIARECGCLTMVDDAHATGVLGANGAGTLEYFGLSGGIDIQMGTLSKAFSSEGGFIAGSEKLIQYLRHRARSFIYSTAMPPQSAAVSLAALQIIREEPRRRIRLLENAAFLRKGLRDAGFQVPGGITPIIPVIVGRADIAAELSKTLYDEGLFIPAIRPPTVREGTSRLRISLMATHTREDLETALDKIIKAGLKSGIIKAGFHE
jgi:8-amino-7-oxononanoate synthase